MSTPPYQPKRYTGKGLATSVREAQERHRRLENARVERLERDVLDRMHREVRAFLRSQPAHRDI